MATTKVINDLIDLNQTGNTTALKGCVGTNANQPTVPTISVQYLVVGGGGGGNGSGSGGAGAGAFVAGTVAVPNNTAVNIAVGQGGSGVLSSTGGEPAGQGQDSGFYTIQGQGGGAGVKRGNGSPGGSGAGGGSSAATAYTGGSSTAYGNNGGDATSSTTWSTGGGGGAGSVGGGGTVGTAGAGGVGSTTTIISTTNANASNANVGEQDGGNLYFAGGGGGGGSDSLAGGNNLGGSGGLGGGGDGTGQCSDCPGGNGTLNTGGGGGGSSAANADTSGGSGGSGVVILRYANTATETIAGSLAGGITTGTTGLCSWPTSSNGVSLFQLENNITDTCGNSTASWSGAAAYSSTAKFGSYSAEFSGGTGGTYINTSVDPDASSNWTVSVWVYRTNTSNFEWFFGTLGTGSSDGFGFSAYNQASNGQIDVYMGNIFGSYTRTRGGSSSFNEWNHFALTHNSSGSGTTTIYQNGQLLTDINLGTNPMTGTSTSDQNWCLASAGTYALERLDGYIDQARFYDTELTATEIQLLYAESVGATKFTESSDTVLVFKAGSGTINLTDTSVSGPKVGDLRTNKDQSSASSASAMEHYTSTGWRVFDNYSTLGICNYPITATSLYQLEGPTVTDTCGNYPGTIVGGVTFAAGKFGNALDLTTSSTYVELQTFPSGWANGTCSLSVWVYMRALTAGSSNGSYIFSANGDWRLQFTSTVGSGISFIKWNTAYGNNGDNDVRQSAVPSLNTWYHVVVTDNQANDATGNLKLYVNGTLADTNDGYASVRAFGAGDYASIGASGEGRNGINGQIDQLRLFPSVLTAAQVTELYNEQ